MLLKLSLTFFLMPCLGLAATLTDASITEFLANNRDNIVDEDGDHSDWIEIQNTSGVSGDLGGWYLTDDPTNLTMWQFPVLELASGGYTGIFASGKDLTTIPPHTNFRLQSSSGGYLALVKPDGVTIATEFINIPAQRPDISFGTGFFLTPTPGAANSASIDGFVADTSFSIDRGFYETAIEVQITTTTPEASIRYTIDGTPPSTTAGILYTGPIAVDETTVIRAIAFRDNFQPTNIDTHTYVFPASVINQPRMRTAITQSGVFGPQMIDSLMAVPTISIVTDNPTPFMNEDGPNFRTDTQTSIEMIHPDGTPGFQEDAGLSNFGGRFTNFDKKSFRVVFQSEFGTSKLNYPLFDGFDYPNFQPTDEFDAINLRSGSHDMAQRGAYMSNRFTDDTMLEMGNIAPHGRFVHLYLNGIYWGQYHLRERWNADMASSYFGESKDDYEAVNANNTGQQFYNGPFDGSNVDGEVYDGSGAEWDQTRSLVAGSEPFLNASNDIDVANVIDFMLLWVMGDSESEFRALGSPANGLPFQFFIKDADGFLRPPNNSSHPVTHNGPLNVMSLMRNDNNPDYNILVADRIHKHYFNDGALTPARNIARLQTRVDEARLGFISEAARWGNIYREPNSWEAFQTNLVNNHFPALTNNRITQFRNAGMYPQIDAPMLNQNGGSIPSGAGITMTTNTTAVYYTADGSDPRLSGGAISPTATLATFSSTTRPSETFITTGAIWSYLDDGSDQGTAWQQLSFDDSSWQSGPSQIGYGESSNATTVGFIDIDPITVGIQRNATTYYRRTITITDPSDFASFLLQLRYDDGAAVYVNGTEVARTSNLPANAAFDTYATSPTPSENTFFEFPISSARFINGENTIAVEIHNSSVGSSDTRLDLILSGLNDLTNANNVTSPVILDEPTLLQARSFDSTTNEWSALTSFFFSIDSIPPTSDTLVISEIHYRPGQPTTAAELAVSTDRDDFEFIELLNTGTQPVDLTGVSFDLGIDFHFNDNTIIEPGGRIVVVKDLAAYTARYGTPAAGVVAGEYAGRLSSGGEQLTLGMVGNITLQDFTYDNTAPWPTAADGEGFSLIFTGSDQGSGNDWSAHSLIHGNPGGPDTAQSSGYNDWKIDNGITDDESDNDNDGLTAFAEYAIGTDPSVPDQATLSGAVISLGNDGHLAVTYQQSLTATDVTFTIQESTDLQNWSTVPSPILVNEITAPSGLTQEVTQRLAAPLAGSPRRFIRVHMAL